MNLSISTIPTILSFPSPWSVWSVWSVFWGRWSLRCDAVWGTLFSEACQGPQMADLGWLRNSWGLMGLLMQRCKHRNGKCLKNPSMDELIPIDGSHLGHRNQTSWFVFYQTGRGSSKPNEWTFWIFDVANQGSCASTAAIFGSSVRVSNRILAFATSLQLANPKFFQKAESTLECSLQPHVS